MLASSETVAPSATTSSLYFDPPYEHQPLIKPSQRSFKKHKVLPRPRTDKLTSIATSSSPSYDLSSSYITTPSLKESGTGPRTIQDHLETRAIGPDLPPTPPAHSRTSSGSQPNLSSTPPPTGNQGPNQTAAGSVTPIPGTPTAQRSPPTPDVTPPQVGRRPRAFRPKLSDRLPSKATVDSRTESFKTARESPTSSDEEKTTPRPCIPPPRTWQSAEGRRLEAKPRNYAGLGLRQNVDDDLTPRTGQEFFAFDGEWVSNSDVEQEWDDNLSRNVVVRKHRENPRDIERRAEVIEDVMVTPTNATKALRSVSLHERGHTAPSPQYLPSELGSKSRSRWTTSTSGSSSSTDVRRSSGMSSKSTVSTVVEAILVDVPIRQQKTLRHVRKQTALRDSGSEFSPPSSTSASVRQTENIRRPRVLAKPPAPRTDSMASTGTMNSRASRKVRREVWQSGGIPVVVIPDRKDSLKSKTSRPPSLRSTNSHRSKRSHSVPRSNLSGAKELPAPSDSSRRRGRSMSVTYGSFPHDQLTMDYPPIVPRRTTSLSAPTSRNTSRAGSRAGSLTAESLKAHNALIEQERVQPPQVTVERAPPTEIISSNQSEQKPLYPVRSVESHKNETINQKPLVDHNGDPFFGKRLTAYRTPFSQASVETNGTHSVADIAEAMAVNIYPHQNKSVLMVHHMSKSLSSTNEKQSEASPVREQGADKFPGNPEITTTGPSDGPVTPPHPQFSMDGVDSPLRNPRAPPEPPAIKFIPATPSGLTPAAEKEKMLGNFFEEPQRRPSLVRRAFSSRKPSDHLIPRRPGILSRTLSLSRTIGRNAAEDPQQDIQNSTARQYPRYDETPPDESKLHPFWRPTDDYVDDEQDDYDTDARYSSFDHGRTPLRRSLSERVRRTFAILPIDDDDHDITTDRRSPERRTIKRTPSGNLRVMPHRGSFSSVRWSGLFIREDDDRPSTAPANSNKRLWGVEKRVDDRGRRLFPGWQDKLEQYRPQNLQRRLSDHRRQKRTEALRQKISGPREVRDGVGEVIKRRSYNGPSYQSSSQAHGPSYVRL